MPAPDVFVFTKKAPFMQRVADLVRNGHTRYVQGEVPISKAAALHAKFSRLYDCHLGKLEASRRRKAGFATSRLLLLWQEGADRLSWLLLATEGRFESGADKLEAWRDALTDRISLTGYELVRLTKPQEPRPVWTWRYTKARQEELRLALISAIRRKDGRSLDQLIHSIWRSPGFAGVRDQIKKFGDLIRSEWKRARKEGEPLPDIPARIGYVQRLPDKGMSLSKLK